MALEVHNQRKAVGRGTKWRKTDAVFSKDLFLRLVVFNLYHKLSGKVRSNGVKSVNDIKPLGVIKHCEELQKDLYQLDEWATKWQIF